MTADDDSQSQAGAAASGAPDPLLVRYSQGVQAFRVTAILALAALCLLIPFAAVEKGPEAWRFAGVLIAAALVWAGFTTRKIFNRDPQVVVDENGVFFREWMVGTVPWENINFIAHSSSVRRGIVASITRTRRKPYLLFRFVELPKVIPTAPPPLSWLQFIRAEFAIQEPIMQQYGLDTPVDEILTSIQAHIAHWQSQRPDDEIHTE